MNFRHLYTEAVKAILIPGIAVLLLAAATIAPASAHIAQWRDAHSAYDAAVARAADVADEHAAALELYDETADAAALTLEDASGVASAGAGYLAAGAIDELTAANATLEEALETEQPDGAEMPAGERPDTPTQIRAAVESLEAWSDGTAASASELDEQATELAELRDTSDEAATAAASSVSTESGSAFGVAPIATAETRSAVEAARDALAAGAESGTELKGLVAAYSAAIEAMFASQRAEAEAAAAREAEESSRVPLPRPNFDDLTRQLKERLCLELPDSCVGNGL